MPSLITAPFDLGKTYYEGRTIDTTSSYANVGGITLEGSKSQFQNHQVLAAGTSLRLTLVDAPMLVKVVRNVSGIALLPGRMVVYKTGTNQKRVDGYTSTTAQSCAGIVDPFLPAAGVADGDLFFIVLEGVIPVRRQLSNSAADDAEDDILYAITAATSQATTAGRFTRWVGTFTPTETTDGSAFRIQRNAIGLAASACTTAGTNQLMNVRVRINHD